MRTLFFQRKGMVAILFLAFGFLVFSYLVVSNKIAHKDTFVGKEALEVYLGGQDVERIRFYYSVASTYALEQALHDHGLQGGLPSQEQCMMNGYRVWFTTDCPFSSEQLAPTLFTLFDPLFHHWISEVSDDIKVDVTIPFTYNYSVKDDTLVVTSPQPLVYHSHNHAFTVPLSLPLSHPDMKTLFSAYDQIKTELSGGSSCLLSLSSNFSSCFSSSSFHWAVSSSQDYLFFTVTSDEFISDIEIRFAIHLNSLDQLSSTDELFISSPEVQLP